MIAKNYICDDCGQEARFSGYQQARRAGWAVSKDYKNCYCPRCAPSHRKGKATEKNFEIVAELPNGWEQLKII